MYCMRSSSSFVPASRGTSQACQPSQETTSAAFIAASEGDWCTEPSLIWNVPPDSTEGALGPPRRSEFIGRRPLSWASSRVDLCRAGRVDTDSFVRRRHRAKVHTLLLGDSTARATLRCLSKPGRIGELWPTQLQEPGSARRGMSCRRIAAYTVRAVVPNSAAISTPVRVRYRSRSHATSSSVCAVSGRRFRLRGRRSMPCRTSARRTVAAEAPTSWATRRSSTIATHRQAAPDRQATQPCGAARPCPVLPDRPLSTQQRPTGPPGQGPSAAPPARSRGPHALSAALESARHLCTSTFERRSTSRRIRFDTSIGKDSTTALDSENDETPGL
jgi:hypothetical protein